MTPEGITELRSRLNLSRANLARFLGVAEMTIVRWENGSDSSPRGLPLVVLQALDAACRLHGADAIGRLVKDSTADLGDALRRLLDLAQGTRKQRNE